MTTKDLFHLEQFEDFFAENDQQLDFLKKRWKLLEKNGTESFPLLIQLCLDLDENSFSKLIQSLFQSKKSISWNVKDHFHCSFFMYLIRYQRYRVIELILNEFSFNWDFHQTDRDGNGILHYAMIYFHQNHFLFIKLIDHFHRNQFNVDQRNRYGWTPLLLGIFFERYDLVSLLLKRSKASVFARDEIQWKNLFDYLLITNPSIDVNKNVSSMDRRHARFAVELHQSIPFGHAKTIFHSSNRIQKNFFEKLFPSVLEDQSTILRSMVSKLFRSSSTSDDFQELLHYLHQRYPSVSLHRDQDRSSSARKPIDRSKSTLTVHQLIDLYEEKPRRKAMLPLVPLRATSSMINSSSLRTSVTLKQLSNRLSMISILSRSANSLRASISLPNNEGK